MLLASSDRDGEAPSQQIVREYADRLPIQIRSRIERGELNRLTFDLVDLRFFSNGCKSFIHGHTEQIRHRSHTLLVSAYGTGSLIWFSV